MVNFKGLYKGKEVKHKITGLNRDTALSFKSKCKSKTYLWKRMLKGEDIVFVGRSREDKNEHWVNFTSFIGKEDSVGKKIRNGMQNNSCGVHGLGNDRNCNCMRYFLGKDEK